MRTSFTGWAAIGAAALFLAGCVKHNDPNDQKGQAAKKTDQTSAEERRKKAREQLSSLGYVDGTVDEDIEKSGVVVHHKSKTFDGYNFYSSRQQKGAQLIDMTGKVVHEWHGPSEKWQHATLLPNGDVVYMVKDEELGRIDKNSKQLWKKEIRAHHDLWIDEDGKIYALARRVLDDRDYHPKLKTVEDYVLVLSPDGEKLHEISVLEAVEKSPYAYLLAQGETLPPLTFTRANQRKRHGEYDILHTNHVEVLDGRLADRHPLYEKGNILLSPRNLNAPFILNPKLGEIVWLWGPNNLIFPHHPTMTDEGRLLIFNNGTEDSGSQVVELDPVTNEVLWTYGPVKDFYSRMRGGNIRLPNGNTLITESDTGYVFEVDEGGKVVWEFVNPHIRRKDKMRMAIWRMERFTRDQLDFEFNQAN